MNVCTAQSEHSALYQVLLTHKCVLKSALKELTALES